MANYNRIKSAKAVPVGTIMPWTGSASSSAVLDDAIPSGYVAVSYTHLTLPTILLV